MKKTYIIPTTRTVAVESHDMICASLGVDKGSSTDKQYSNRNDFFLDEDELEKELDGKW